jgi:hypothetical protein
MKKTPASLLRNVEQGIQSLPDAHPDQCRMPVHAAWLAPWKTMITTARVAIEDPLAAAPAVLVILVALVVFGVGAVLGWLVGCAF